MKWVIRTFEDLVFETDTITKIKFAVMDGFVNGYGVRVVETIDGYDMIVLKNKLEYNKTHLQKNELMSLNKNQVTNYMKQIQEFGRQFY